MKKVARHWIEYVQDWRDAPMAYWVHVEETGSDWRASCSYSPAAPVVEGRNGYPVLCVESQGFVFLFSSAAQLVHCIDVLGRKPLPTSRRLSAIRGGTHGPNSHWLSRLPGHIRSPKVRQRAVDDLCAVVSAMASDGTSFAKKQSPLLGRSVMVGVVAHGGRADDRGRDGRWRRLATSRAPAQC